MENVVIREAHINAAFVSLSHAKRTTINTVRCACAPSCVSHIRTKLNFDWAVICVNNGAIWTSETGWKRRKKEQIENHCHCMLFSFSSMHSVCAPIAIGAMHDVFQFTQHITHVQMCLVRSRRSHRWIVFHRLSRQRRRLCSQFCSQTNMSFALNVVRANAPSQ